VNTRDKYKSKESNRRKECKIKTTKKEGKESDKKKKQGRKRMTQTRKKQVIKGRKGINKGAKERNNKRNVDLKRGMYQ
jgi:hypothetical protein